MYVTRHQLILLLFLNGPGLSDDIKPAHDILLHTDRAEVYYSFKGFCFSFKFK